MRLVEKKENLLGTVIEIKLPEYSASLFDGCFREIRRIEQTYSRFIDTSELSKANAKLNAWQQVSEEFIYLINEALKYNKLTDGNFDIPLKANLEQLGYDKDYSFTPKHFHDKKIKDPILVRDQSILLRKEIEFGGLGKGFALDQVASLLNKAGISHYYVNAGGDIYARQYKEPWTILMEHPDDPEKAIGKININKQAIASSSSNRRKWKGYHHLLNAKSRMPAIGVKSIFVLAEKGVEADAYATALFCAGFSQAVNLSKKLSIDVLIISKENKFYKSEGFKVDFFD